MRRQTGLFKVLVCALFGAISTAAQAPASLTLQQAEQIALTTHPLIRAAEDEAKAAQEQTTETRSVYFPFLYASLTGAEAEHSSRIAAGGLNNPVIFNRYSNGLTAAQLVTDFGRTANLVSSYRLRANAAQSNARVSRADILLGVDEAFFEALRAQTVLQVAQKTVSQRKLVADNVSALAKGQLRSELDVSFANVNLAQAQLLLIKAQNDQEASQAVLSAALGYSELRSFILVDEAGAPAALPALEDAMAQALHSRPELAEQRFRTQAAQKFEKAERDLWFPTISVLGTAGTTPYRQSGLTSRYAAAGFNVNIPIFNGGLFSARRAEAGYRADEEDKRLRDLADRVSRDVRVAWLNARTTFQNLDVTARLLDEANRALDLAQARYKLGLSSIVELGQAELNQTEAEIEQKTAKYEYEKTIAALNYQMGQVR